MENKMFLLNYTYITRHFNTDSKVILESPRHYSFTSNIALKGLIDSDILYCDNNINGKAQSVTVDKLI